MGVPHMMHVVRVGWLSWKQMEHGHSSSPRSTKLSAMIKAVRLYVTLPLP